MNLKFMFFLLNPDDLEQKLSVGMMLYPSREMAWAPHLGVEQHGNIFCRGSVAPERVNPPELGETCTVEREVKGMIDEALRRAEEKQPELSAELEDYALYNFSIGFEGMGHWASEATLSSLSLEGAPVP